MGVGAQLYGRRKNGDQIRIEAALTPVELADEKMVLATIVDLSERLATERAVAAKDAAEAQVDRLILMNDELIQFAYSASHDLKAPLTTITGVLRLCLEDLKSGDNDEVEANLSKLVSLAATSAEKVESVLKLARVGHDEAPASEIDLEAMTKRLWGKITLADPSPPCIEVNVELDAAFASVPRVLEFIVENLLSIAYQYRDFDKTENWVRVTARQEREWVSITVSDNGVGIPKCDRDAVFRMFRKLSERSGHGLGLAIVRRRIYHLGGSIKCSGNLGEGTEFEMRLPIRML